MLALLEQKPNISSIIKLHIEEAKETLNEAVCLLNNRMFKGANNRAYYAIFHLLTAIAVYDGKDFKKHSQLLGYFNKNYLNTGIFPKSFSKRISTSEEKRHNCDYLALYVTSQEETEEQIKTAQDLLLLMKNFSMKK